MIFYFRIFSMKIESILGCCNAAEIIPIEFRMKLQPDPDNAGGGRYDEIF